MLIKSTGPVSTPARQRGWLVGLCGAAASLSLAASGFAGGSASSHALAGDRDSAERAHWLRYERSLPGGFIAESAAADAVARAESFRRQFLTSAGGRSAWASSLATARWQPGGDGASTVADAGDPLTVYSTHSWSRYSRSTDGGKTFAALPPLPLAAGEAPAFYTPLAADSSGRGDLLGGAQRVYRGQQAAGAFVWTPLSAGPLFPRDVIRRIAGAAGSPVIYASGGAHLAKGSVEAGAWTPIDPPGGQFITGVAVDPQDPQDVVCSRSGYTGGQVVRTTDGGASWRDVTANLPNVPVNNVTLQAREGRLDAYLATDAGVYYADLHAAAPAWAPVAAAQPPADTVDVRVAPDGERLLAVTRAGGVSTLRLPAGRGYSLEANEPAPASGLTATVAGNNQIDLRWEDNSANETGFRVERKVGGGAFATRVTTGPNVTEFSDTGLASNTTYVYRVIAFNGNGSAAPSREAGGTTTSTPAAPTQVRVVPVSASRLRITWRDQSDNESGFKIERSTDGTNFVVVGTSPADDQNFTDTGLASNTSYTYRVRATNAAADSAPSPSVSGLTLPSTPSGLTVAAASNTSLDVRWTDTSAVPSGFELERSADGGVTFTLAGAPAAGATSFLDTGLAPKTTYLYRIRAANASGTSAFSATASAITAPDRPAAPAGLTATPLSQTSLQLNWTDTGQDETGFKVERSLDNGQTYEQIGTTGPDVATFFDSGLTANTNYFYRVRATNATGDSLFSNVANVTTLPNAPTAPTTLTGTVLSQTAIQLDWVDTSNNETGFVLERSVDGETTFAPLALPRANSVIYIDMGLVPDSTYQYRLRAVNDGGQSAFSNTLIARTLAVPPGAPSALVVTTLSGTSLKLDWADGSFDETGFKIERSTDGGVNFTQVAVTPDSTVTFTDTGLTPGATYHYRLRATKVGGDSAYSNIASGQTQPNAPTSPRNIMVTPLTQTSLRIMWDDRSDNETSFKLERSIDGSSYVQLALLDANVAGYTDTNLTANTSYFYRVRATNAGGDSSYSEAVSGTTFASPPRAPLGLSVSALSQTSLRLDWTDTTSDETGFKIERVNSDGTTTTFTVGANTPTFTDVNLTGGATYSYRVRALKGQLESDATNTATGTTLPSAPTSPGELALTVLSTDSIRLFWRDQSQDETGFLIERSDDEGGSFSQIATVGSDIISYTDSGLLPGSTYVYRVRSTGTGGNSLPSNAATAATNPEAPLAPIGLAVSAAAAPDGERQLTLSWSDPTGAATGFKVERRAGNQPFNEIATLAAGETVYTDTTLTQNTRYTYRVRATNAGGASPYSTEASGLTVPSAPSELAAVVTGAGRLRLTWANSSGSDVGFKLERRIGSGAFTQIATLGPGTTAYNDSGLASGASVTYRLRSFNQGGGSSFSNEAQATLAESLAAVSFGVESLRGGARVQGTVALTGPARQTITVALSSSDPKIATVPGSVTIAKGKTRATFTLRTKRVRTDGAVVTVTARATGTSRSAELEVTRGR